MAGGKKSKANDRVGAEAKKVLSAFLGPVDKIRKNPRRAMARPRTSVERLKRDVETSVTQQFKHESAFIGLVSRMLDLIPADLDAPALAQQELDAERARLAKDNVGAELLALCDAADRNGPISPLLLLYGRLDDEAVDTWSISAKFEEAARSRGEKCANALRDAIPDLVERMYVRHLQTMWGLSFLERGEWPPPPPQKLYDLITKATARLRNKYPSLVNDEARHLRNSVAHRTAEYVPSRRKVEFRDQAWQKSMSLSELTETLRALWHVSLTLRQRLRQILTSSVYIRSGMFAIFSDLRDALRGDVVAIKALTDRNLDSTLSSQYLRRSPAPGEDLWFLPPQ